MHPQLLVVPEASRMDGHVLMAYERPYHLTDEEARLIEGALWTLNTISDRHPELHASESSKRIDEDLRLLRERFRTQMLNKGIRPGTREGG